jgi:diketogulonate reductase-like aldo/keto reductase
MIFPRKYAMVLFIYNFLGCNTKKLLNKVKDFSYAKHRKIINQLALQYSISKNQIYVINQK